MSEITGTMANGRFRVRVGLVIVLAGLFFFLLGADPGMFDLDRSPVVGFVQIAVFLVGLAMICVGGYISLAGFWNGREKTIAADLGLRLVSTGYVIAVVAGMADVFGFGSHSFPAVPYFGPLQAIGVILSELIIAVGFILLFPIRRAHSAYRETSQTSGMKRQPSSVTGNG